tara:strand:+ start:2988 stop:3119 length:132 start_codon:yes stop_codon:yes gene_type:complete
VDAGGLFDNFWLGLQDVGSREPLALVSDFCDAFFEASNDLRNL